MAERGLFVVEGEEVESDLGLVFNVITLLFTVFFFGGGGLDLF